MANFSFRNVQVLNPKRRKRKHAVSLRKRVALDDAIEILVAKKLDPEAWSGVPQPSFDELQKQIDALTEDIEWITAIPTTPEGEYRLIRAERHAREQMLLRKVVVSEAAALARRTAAIAKAKEALKACQALVDSKPPLLIIQGKVRRRKA